MRLNLYSGTLALLVAILELAFLPILLSIGGKSLGVIQTMFLSFLVGTPLSLALLYVYRGHSRLHKMFASKRVIAAVIIAGILNYGVAQLLLTVGTLGTNSSVASVIYRLWVLFFVLLSPLLLRNSINKRQVLATFIGLFGVYVIATNGSLVSFNGLQSFYVLVLLLAAVSAALSNLIIKRYNVSALDVVVLSNVSSLALAAILMLAFHAALPAHIGASELVAVLFLGIVTYTLGAFLYFFALKTLNPIIVSNSLLSIPFLTIIFSFIILAVPLRAYYFYAAALIGLSIAVQSSASGSVPVYSARSRQLRGMRIVDVTSIFAGTIDALVYSFVRGRNKALAMPMGKDMESRRCMRILSKHGCKAFVSDEPSYYGIADELSRSAKLVGAKTVLVAIGNPRSIERALVELTKNQG